MVTNGGNTEGLFRAAFMQSGSPQPITDITAVELAFYHRHWKSDRTCRVNHITTSSLKALVVRSPPTP